MAQPRPRKSLAKMAKTRTIEHLIIDMPLRIPPPPRLVRQVGYMKRGRGKINDCTVA